MGCGCKKKKVETTNSQVKLTESTDSTVQLDNLIKKVDQTKDTGSDN